MNENNAEEIKEESVEGLVIMKEKATELKKEEFFEMLAASKGIELTIKRLGNTYKSKWKNDKEEYPSGFFIDYTFTKEEVEYEVGISYNVGVPIAEETFILTSGMNIFKILNVAIDISKADEIKVTKDFLESTLTGVKFLGKIGAGYNGFIIDPVKKLE